MYYTVAAPDDRNHIAFNNGVYMYLKVLDLRTKLFGEKKALQIEIFAAEPDCRSYFSLYKSPPPSNFARFLTSVEEAPQWVTPKEPQTMKIRPSTLIMVRITLAVGWRDTTDVETRTVLILNELIDAARDISSRTAVLNIPIWKPSDLILASLDSEPEPVGLLRLQVEYDYPRESDPKTAFLYYPPKNAPLPDLTEFKQQESTDISTLKTLCAYTAITKEIFPSSPPALVDLTRLILARCSRFHWSANSGLVFDKNPAEHILRQLKELLLFIRNSPAVLDTFRYEGRRDGEKGNSWEEAFPDIQLPSKVYDSLVQGDKGNNDQAWLTSALVTEAFKVACIMDYTMFKFRGLSESSFLWDKAGFGREVYNGQESLLRIRFRISLVLLKDLHLPAETTTRAQVIHVILRLISARAAHPNDVRLLTDALLSLHGSVAERVLSDVYHVIVKELRVSFQNVEERMLFRRLLKRLVKKFGVLPRDLRPSHVRKYNIVASNGYAETFKGRWNREWFHGAPDVDISIQAWSVINCPSKAETLRNEFLAEAVTWSTVRHDRVLQCYGCTEVEGLGQFCLIFPSIKGKSARDRCAITAEDRLDLMCRKRLLAEIAEGMAYLHNEDIIHGDLRGVNVLVTVDNHAVVTNFGLNAYGFGVSQPHLPCMVDNFRWTAPELMDPSLLPTLDATTEQSSDNENRQVTFGATMQSDIYSYACTCVELLDGRVPYFDQSKSEVAVIYYVLGTQSGIPGRPARPYELVGPADDVLWDIIQQCWVPIDGNMERPGFCEIYEGFKKMLSG